MTIPTVRLAAVAAVLSMAPLGAAADTPYQILALVANPDGVALQCTDAACTADLSAFCLQKGKATPGHGVRYHLARVDSLTLVGETADGETRRIAGSSDWLIRAERDQVAVRVSVPRAVLATHKLRHARLAVAADATLIPDGPEADRAATAADPMVAVLRQAGSRLVDQDRSRAAAVRLLAGMAGTLPANAGTPADRSAHLPQLPALRRAVSPAATPQLSDTERELARQQLDICEIHTDLGAYHSLRQCLEVQHDLILWTLNVDYWLAFDRGS